MLPPEPLCLIAISGGSGSGKSTLANALMAVLGPDLCAVLGDDHYYKTNEKHFLHVYEYLHHRVNTTI